MDADTVIASGTTVEDLEERFEGTDFLPGDPEADHFICDFCSTGVKYKSQPTVGHYVCDDVLNDNHPHSDRIHRERPLVNLASYCEECTTKMLLFPCESFSEVRLLFELDEERVMKNARITDVSQRDDGIPWDPKELSEKITGVSFAANAIMAGSDQLWGPENMVTFFLSAVSGVDIRELVKWDGSIDPKMLGQARRKYEEFQKKMSAQGHSRRAFRDSVRGQ